MISKNFRHISFLTASLFFSSINLIAQDDYDGYVFKNQVASVRTINDYSNDSLVFNRDGKVTEVWTEIWIKETSDFNGWELIRTLKYDEYGNKAEYRAFSGNRLYEYYIFKYDEKNNLIERTYFLLGDILLGDIEEKRIYTYTEKNQLLTEEYYQNDELLVDVRYTYNEKGLLSKTESSRATYEYTYDSYGRIIEEKAHTTDLNGKTHDYITTNKYNDYGRLVEQIAKNKKGKVLSSISYTYDKAGVCSSYTITRKKKSLVHTVVYEYDAMGNWIKQITRDSIEDLITNERIITYY